MVFRPHGPSTWPLNLPLLRLPIGSRSSCNLLLLATHVTDAAVGPSQELPFRKSFNPNPLLEVAPSPAYPAPFSGHLHCTTAGGAPTPGEMLARSSSVRTLPENTTFVACTWRNPSALSSPCSSATSSSTR